MVAIFMALGLLISLIAIAVVLTLLLLGASGMISFRVRPLQDLGGPNGEDEAKGV